MSRRRLIVMVALAGLVGAGIVFVVTRGGDEVDATSAASLGGGDEAAAALWQKLARLSAWLPSFEGALSDPEPEAKTVLAAFAALVDKVGGPSGFWRDTVPNELLSCHREPEQPVCRKLDEGLPELTDGEALARQIGRLDETRAEVFLARNADAMLRWVETFAPSDASADAMRKTSYWQEKLAPAVAGQQ